MNNEEILELKNYDPEDISDVLVKVEKSFGFTFRNDELKDTRTFGELCDTISSKIELEHAEDCTSQQVFYKIRQSIAKIQSLGKKEIALDCELETIFPKKGRRRKVLQIRKELGFPLKILKPKDWINYVLLFILLSSLVELFINWRFGLIGLAVSFMGFRIADWFGKEFAVKTVGEAATKAARENYVKSRRNPKTANRQEIVKKIKELFTYDLDPSVLTREAPLF